MSTIPYFLVLTILLVQLDANGDSTIESGRAENSFIGQAASTVYLLVLFAPSSLMLLELFLEEGVWPAFRRFAIQILTLSPIFETFKGKLMGSSFVSELTVGGSQYIPTGRGLSIERVAPHSLFKAYALSNVRDGAMLGAMLAIGHVLGSTSLKLWQVSLVLWLTVVSNVLAPCIFNPNQFQLKAWRKQTSIWWDWLCHIDTLDATKKKDGWREWRASVNSSTKPAADQWWLQRLFFPSIDFVSLCLVALVVFGHRPLAHLKTPLEAFLVILFGLCPCVLAAPLVGCAATYYRKSARVQASKCSLPVLATLCVMASMIEVALAINVMKRGVRVGADFSTTGRKELTQDIIRMLLFKVFATRVTLSVISNVEPRLATKRWQAIGGVVHGVAEDVAESLSFAGDAAVMLATMGFIGAVSLIPGAHALHSLMLFRVLPAASARALANELERVATEKDVAVGLAILEGDKGLGNKSLDSGSTSMLEIEQFEMVGVENATGKRPEDTSRSGGNSRVLAETSGRGDANALLGIGHGITRRHAHGMASAREKVSRMTPAERVQVRRKSAEMGWDVFGGGDPLSTVRLKPKRRASKLAAASLPAISLPAVESAGANRAARRASLGFIADLLVSPGYGNIINSANENGDHHSAEDDSYVESGTTI